MNPEALASDVPVLPRSLRLRLWLPAVAALMCITASFFVHYTGNVPAGWQHSDGTVTGAVGRLSQGQHLYYPTVQYLAMGYTYEITAAQGSDEYPVLGTKVPMLFNTENPAQGELANDTSLDYYALGLRALGIVLLLAWAPAALRLLRGARRQPALVTEAPAEAVLAAPEAEPQAVTAEEPLPAEEPTETMGQPAETTTAPPEETASEVPLYTPGEAVAPEPLAIAVASEDTAVEIAVETPAPAEVPPAPAAPAAPRKIEVRLAPPDPAPPAAKKPAAAKRPAKKPASRKKPAAATKRTAKPKTKTAVKTASKKPAATRRTTKK